MVLRELPGDGKRVPILTSTWVQLRQGVQAARHRVVRPLRLEITDLEAAPNEIHLDDAGLTKDASANVASTYDNAPKIEEHGYVEGVGADNLIRRTQWRPSTRRMRFTATAN